MPVISCRYDKEMRLNNKQEVIKMALGILMIVFVVMSVVSILGLIMLYMVRSEKAGRGVFYAMAIWGLIVAVLSAISFPGNWMAHQIIAWGFGFLSVAGIIVNVAVKREGKCIPAYLLVTVSVIGGLCGFFGMFL